MKKKKTLCNGTNAGSACVLASYHINVLLKKHAVLWWVLLLPLGRILNNEDRHGGSEKWEVEAMEPTRVQGFVPLALGADVPEAPGSSAGCSSTSGRTHRCSVEDGVINSDLPLHHRLGGCENAGQCWTSSMTVCPIYGMLYYTESDGTKYTIFYQFGINIWYKKYIDIWYIESVMYRIIWYRLQ